MINLPQESFFVYGSENGIEYFNTIEEAKLAATKSIENYLDGGEWDESVESIQVGKILFSVQKTDVKHRPPDDQLTDGYAVDGYYWGEHELTCNYELRPL